MDWTTFGKQLAAGGLSGCAAKIVIAPLDRTKILLQVQHPYYKHHGVFRCVYEIARREGVPALWKGNTLMMIRIFPYASIQFFAYDRFQRVFSTAFGQHAHVAKLMAGSCAGVTSVVMTYPLDMVRARIAFQITGEDRYVGMRNAFAHIYRENGARSFFRGMSATVVGMIPYAGVSFFTFNTLKETMIKSCPELLARPDHNNPDQLVLHTWTSLLTGGLAGAISQTVSFPFDVARRRMQLAAELPDSHRFRGIWSTLSYVYHKHGVSKGLFRGLSINYIRVVPQQAIAFTTYEFIREKVGLTGKPHK